MKRILIWIGLIIVLVAAAVITGCAVSNGGVTVAHNMNELVPVGTGAWKVVGVERVKQTTAGAKATGEFVFVNIQLKNISNEAVNLTGIEVELVDEDNNTYNFDSQQNSTFLTSMGKDSLIKGRIEAGESVSGWIAFDIPADSNGVKIRVRDLDITSSKSALIDLKV